MRRPAAIVIVGLLASAVVACSKGSPQVTCADPTQTTTVDVREFSYTPACVEAASGSTLTITDSGSQPHSFTVKGTEVNVMVPPGTQAQVPLGGVAPGTYRVVCTIHPQMVAALKVD